MIVTRLGDGLMSQLARRKEKTLTPTAPFIDAPAPLASAASRVRGPRVGERTYEPHTHNLVDQESRTLFCPLLYSPQSIRLVVKQG